MTKRQLFLVRKALRRIEAAEIARLDAGPAVEWVPTQKYTAAMQKLLAQDKKRARSLFYGVKKRTIVGLIAAIIALLLTATACVFHHEIEDFFSHISEKRTVLEADVENDRIVLYRMSWIPEGYVLTTSRSFSALKTETWKDGEAEITFVQSFVATPILLDQQDRPYRTRTVGEKTIYYTKEDRNTLVVWRDANASFTLTCPGSLLREEIDHMIRSVVPIGD